MEYILVVIVLLSNGHETREVAYPDQDTCFEAREYVILEYGRPIINYQAVCIPKAENIASRDVYGEPK